MKLINQAMVLTKRILAHTAYVLMLTALVLLTLIYRALPDREKSTEIIVAMYYEESGTYEQQLKKELEEMNSIYTYRIMSSEEEVVDTVKSGKAECGICIPKGFFESYIAGNEGIANITVYTIPETTLASPISETVFSNILKISAKEIMTNTVNKPELNSELEALFDKYIDSTDIFVLDSITSEKYSFEKESYTINIPVHEISLVLIIFTALLGLLLFQKDSERNMYISLSRKEKLSLKLLTISTAMLPLLFVCAMASIIVYGVGSRLISLLTVSVVSYLATLLLGLIIRKSTHLSKVLPLVAFVSTVIIFYINLI